MSNYKSAIDRINKAQTVEELHKISEGLERVYRWAQLTDSEYMRLDGKLCDRINLLSWQRLRAEHPAIERVRR